MLATALHRWRSPRFSVGGTERARHINATHGTPRAGSRSTAASASVHAFRCLPWMSGRGGSTRPARRGAARGRCPRSTAHGSAPRRTRRSPRTRRGARRRVRSRTSRRSGVGLVHVVVEQVAESRDRRRHRGRVVVRTEHRGRRGVGERGPDPLDRVGVHLDVGVDEHERLVAGPCGAGVAGASIAVSSRGPSTTITSSSGPHAARTAARHRSRVAGRFVAGITTESGSIGGDYSVNRT